MFTDSNWCSVVSPFYSSKPTGRPSTHRSFNNWIIVDWNSALLSGGLLSVHHFDYRPLLPR